MFGTIEPRKGQDLAINGVLALPKNLQTRIKFNIFGRVSSEKNLQTILELAEGHKFIEIEDGVPHEEYLRKIAKSDIVMITSRDEPFSWVGLDALMFGIPIICGTTVGIHAYLENNKSAVILSNLKAATIAEAVFRLASDPKLRKSIGKGARDIYKKHFTLQAFAARLQAEIEVR